MTSSSSAQHPAAENACRITLGQVNQVRPKLPLLKILQAAGAQGETFTLKEVMHYLGQYIMVRQLYDKRQQHMVYCGGDQLGELLGLESFSVKDPSPVYDMLKRNLTSAAMADAAQNLAKEQSVDKPSQDQLKFSRQEGSDTGIMEGESNASALSTSEQKCENYEDKDLIENLSKSKKPKLDLVFEEWDVAGLPWWFLGNLRSNYKSRSNGSTDIQTNQDIDTAVVSDTTDDLWFLNECPSDQSSAAVKVEMVDCEEVKEGDKKVTEDARLHDFEDSQCLSDDTDTEAASEAARADPVTSSEDPSLTRTRSIHGLLAPLMSPVMLLLLCIPKSSLLQRPPAPWDKFKQQPHPQQHPLQTAGPSGEEPVLGRELGFPKYCLAEREGKSCKQQAGAVKAGRAANCKPAPREVSAFLASNSSKLTSCHLSCPAAFHQPDFSLNCPLECS